MVYNIFNETEDSAGLDGLSSINDILSSQAVSKVDMLKSGKTDHLLIRGVKISDILPPTPKNIRESIDIRENKIISIVGEYLGNISDKGIENSIRFDIGGNNNTETWHNHRQYKYSVFLCLKDDPNPKTYLLSANILIAESDSEKKDFCCRRCHIFPSKNLFLWSKILWVEDMLSQKKYLIGPN